MTISGTIAASIGLTALHVVLSTFVTVHVLLHKRDIGSSIGWIGLAWLSPLLGSALYCLLGINRVRERAKSLKRPRRGGEAGSVHRAIGNGDTLAAIDRTSLRLTRRTAEPGNTVTPLHKGDEAYHRMLAAIEAAKASVEL